MDPQQVKPAIPWVGGVAHSKTELATGLVERPAALLRRLQKEMRRVARKQRRRVARKQPSPPTPNIRLVRVEIGDGRPFMRRATSAAVVVGR